MVLITGGGTNVLTIGVVIDIEGTDMVLSKGPGDGVGAIDIDQVEDGTVVNVLRDEMWIGEICKVEGDGVTTPISVETGPGSKD